MSLQAPTPQLDRYVVIHVATTCDEHGVYVTRDTAEVIELGWILLDTNTCEELHHESVLVKPVNTPITPLCTSLTTLTWEHVRTAGTFRDAINRFDAFAQEHILSRNLEFAFVTLDAWDMRVQLPREARDKGVVLPPYLQHSRTFDLRTEYQRWQQHHPESLPFGPSNLANICAALEVEAVQSSAPIKHNLPFHLQALAPQSPRRAMEEAVTLARVLRGLIRKSQPPNEHPDMLTRPMDARADVRAFLAERSKILYMSGLPHDTTQSELESWYTQYGGRPIAFFTLQTPDQHKPTGKGFAVFSSHEEAAESLCMNGRALNDKAIEVCPSSSRVLDRAAAVEILAPFPPSKNRPRPGDWTCPSCGFSNFQRRTACFRCSFPAVPPNPAAYGYGYGHLPHQHHLMGHHGSHLGGGYHGGRGMGGGASGGVVPFRAGDWKCGRDGCGYHNFAKNVACLRCQAPRSNAAVIPDSAAAAAAAAAAAVNAAFAAPPHSSLPTPDPQSFGVGAHSIGLSMPGHASMPSMSMPGHVGLGVNTPASTNVSGSATSVAAVTPTGTGGFGSFGSGVFGHGSQLVPPNTYGLPAGAGGTITNHGSHGPYSGIGSVGMGMGGMVGMGMGTGIGGMPAPHYSHTGAASNLVMPYAVGSEATASAGTPGNAQQAPAGPSAASTSGNTTSAGDGGGAAPTDNGANNSSASASTTPTGAARGHSTTPGHAHSHSHHGFGNPAAQAAFSSAPSDHSAVANNAGLYGQVGVSGVGVGGSEADPFGFLTREFAGLSVEPAGAASAPGRSQHGGGKSPLKACTN